MAGTALAGIAWPTQRLFRAGSLQVVDGVNDWQRFSGFVEKRAAFAGLVVYAFQVFCDCPAVAPG